jgi:hypothetical protein
MLADESLADLFRLDTRSIHHLKEKRMKKLLGVMLLAALAMFSVGCGEKPKPPTTPPATMPPKPGPGSPGGPGAPAPTTPMDKGTEGGTKPADEGADKTGDKSGDETPAPEEK